MKDKIWYHAPQCPPLRVPIGAKEKNRAALASLKVAIVRMSK
jgi:hypothetical protein